MKQDLVNEEFLNAYDQCADAIFRHCYFRISDRERAKDLMQETFVRTWQYLIDGGDIKNMRAFLYRVANNLIVDEYRKKKEVSLEELRDGGFDPSIEDRERIEHFIEGKHALTTLEKIDSSYREVIVMRYIDDLAPKDIAEILGETENAVSVRIHRGLKKMSELLRHERGAKS